MTNRENALAILRYQNYQRVPVVHFGFWPETIQIWAEQGYIDKDLAYNFDYDSAEEAQVSQLLGFDFGWGTQVNGQAGLFPFFEREILEHYEDGRILVRDRSGSIVIEKPGTVSIPSEVGHTLEDRESWENLVEPRLRWSPDRVDFAGLDKLASRCNVGKTQADNQEDRPRGLWCGSLYGAIRDMLGIENCAYLSVDDPALYMEIIDRIGYLAYSLVDETLHIAEERGLEFDFGHYWEDICFKNGPLISPRVFSELVGPWYRKISDRLAASGIDLISLDCDGKIDDLLPIWLENGVNIMFPIEVGTWKASIKPWREKYGPQVRGIGGMEKAVFSRDRKAVDAEIERNRQFHPIVIRYKKSSILIAQRRHQDAFRKRSTDIRAAGLYGHAQANQWVVRFGAGIGSGRAA